MDHAELLPRALALDDTAHHCGRHIDCIFVARCAGKLGIWHQDLEREFTSCTLLLNGRGH